MHTHMYGSVVAHETVAKSYIWLFTAPNDPVRPSPEAEVHPEHVAVPDVAPVHGKVVTTPAAWSVLDNVSNPEKMAGNEVAMRTRDALTTGLSDGMRRVSIRSVVEYDKNAVALTHWSPRFCAVVLHATSVETRDPRTPDRATPSEYMTMEGVVGARVVGASEGRSVVGVSVVGAVGAMDGRSVGFALAAGSPNPNPNPSAMAARIQMMTTVAMSMFF